MLTCHSLGMFRTKLIFLPQVTHPDFLPQSGTGGHLCRGSGSLCPAPPPLPPPRLGSCLLPPGLQLTASRPAPRTQLSLLQWDRHHAAEAWIIHCTLSLSDKDTQQCSLSMGTGLFHRKPLQTQSYLPSLNALSSVTKQITAHSHAWAGSSWPQRIYKTVQRQMFFSGLYVNVTLLH